MPRPRKCRRVGCLPSSQFFGPFLHGRDHCPPSGEAVVMTVDEFEAIRLIDHLGRNQEECAASMAVARTTAQRIYDEARRKLADCLVHGRPLIIEGGDYIIHPEVEAACPGPRCCRRNAGRQAEPPIPSTGV